MAAQNERSGQILEWVLSDRYRLLFHGLFWLFVYSDEVLSILGVTDDLSFNAGYVFISFLIDVTLVYTNLYLLIPRFLLTNRIWYYIFFTLISIIISMELGLTLAFPTFCPSCPEEPLSSPVTILVQDFVHTALVLGMAVGVHIARRFLRNRAKIQELETTSLKSELAFLKHQINPHFLFNSLNNIYVLNKKAPRQASESILLLSDLLRYQLYDCAKDKVFLKEEIEYLKNYMQLDKLRKSKTKVDFEVIGYTDGQLVAPFLFVPFVENAVKHGISLENESFIRIKFDIQPREVHFYIENSKPAKAYPNIKGGIGLANVKRRLDLLYPDRHRLKITNEADLFKVELELIAG